MPFLVLFHVFFFFFPRSTLDGPRVLLIAKTMLDHARHEVVSPAYVLAGRRPTSRLTRPVTAGVLVPGRWTMPSIDHVAWQYDDLSSDMVLHVSMSITNISGKRP